MVSWFDSSDQQATPEEQQLYDHLLLQVQVESPDQMLKRFRDLFINGFSYSEPEVLTTLDKITASSNAEQRFQFFLNRCCYILINRWQNRSQHKRAILELISFFRKPISVTAAGIRRYEAVKRLRYLVQIFIQSEQYQTLNRLAAFVEGSLESNNEETKPLATLLQRYPYIYDHCLLSRTTPYEQQQVIRQAQAQTQKQFEVNLWNYLNYQGGRSNSSEKTLQPPQNPTLLSDRELWVALNQLIGKAEENSNCQDLAQQFLSHNRQVQTYGAFKDAFYQYLVPSIAPKYGQSRFNNQLHACLRSMSPQTDSQDFNDFLFVRTCSQLLNFLVVESAHQPRHYIFMDLITNIGPSATIRLLLKIVLVCKKVKPYLEKRFAILFNHYESYSQSGVQWLVKCMENLNIAWSSYFGILKFPDVNQLFDSVLGRLIF